MAILVQLSMIASFLLPIILLAAITTGDSYSKTTVKTQVEGEGSVYTKIETEVNGQKKVLESSKEGEYTVELKSEGASSSVQETEQDKELDVSATKNEPEDFQKEKNFLQKIIEFFTKLFDRFL